MTDPGERHPATQQIMQWFSYEHLPAGAPRHVSAMCAYMAGELLRELPDSHELTAGLRKLLEAKDCLVRAAIEAGRAAVTEPFRGKGVSFSEVRAEAGLPPVKPPPLDD